MNKRIKNNINKLESEPFQPTRLFIIFSLVVINSSLIGQKLVDWNETNISSKYGYSIKIPNSFTKYKPLRSNTDLAFKDSYGSSITVNVTDRLPEEYEITAHNYTKEMLEQGMRQAYPNFTITRCERILIGNTKTFFTCNYGEHPKLSSMKAFFYHKDKAYVVNCTTETSRFKSYEKLFWEVIKSIKLKK